MLVRARQDLIGHRIAVANQLLAVLQHHFPGAVGLFSQLDIPISLAFLRRFPTQADAACLSQRRLANWLQANGSCGRQTAAELLAHLEQAAHGRDTTPVTETTRLLVTTFVELLTQLRGQLATLQSRIHETLLAHPDGPIFASLPRAGTIRAATLLAQFGDCRARYPDPTALAAAAGVAPSTRQSGNFLHVAFRRGCNTNLRAALVDWAQDTPRANAWAHDTYQRARARGCRHPHATPTPPASWPTPGHGCCGDAGTIAAHTTPPGTAA